MPRKTITITGGTSWVVPSDWNDTDNRVHVYGGGGAWAYKDNVSLISGELVSLAIGGPGEKTWFISPDTICADGAAHPGAEHQSEIIIEYKPIFLTATIHIDGGTTWTVPKDWNNKNNKIHCIGGGGNGGTSSGSFNNSWGGGGGGWGYKTNAQLTRGQVVNIAVGGATADTWFISAAYLGGKGGTNAWSTYPPCPSCAGPGEGGAPTGGDGGASGARGAVETVNTFTQDGGVGGHAGGWNAGNPYAGGPGEGAHCQLNGPNYPAKAHTYGGAGGGAVQTWPQPNVGGAQGGIIVEYEPAASSAPFVRNGGSWQQIKGWFVRNAGAWREVKDAWVKSGGKWLQLTGDGGGGAVIPKDYEFTEDQEWVIPNYNTIEIEAWGGGGGGGSGNACVFVPGANGNRGETGGTAGLGLYAYANGGQGGNGGCYCSGVHPCCGERGEDGSGKGQTITKGGGGVGGTGSGPNGGGQGGGTGGTGCYIKSKLTVQEGPGPGVKMTVYGGRAGRGGKGVENGGRVTADGNPGTAGKCIIRIR